MSRDTDDKPYSGGGIGKEGYFVFDECYNVDQDDVDEFDKNFEPKKKEVRDDHLG